MTSSPQMGPQDTGKLLGLMAMFDHRTVSAPDVAAWLHVIGDLRYSDCEQAVYAHYRESRERIMPADVRQRVAEIRKQRIEAAPPVEIPEHLADHPVEARDWKQRTLTAIADGADPQLAIGSGQ